VIVEYTSNNSGGKWWLTDDDWHALEAAGWKVEWAKDDTYYQSSKLLENDRWLGALATRATLECDSLESAVRSFEKHTGQDIQAKGCSCCGPPHSFWVEEPLLRRSL